MRLFTFLLTLFLIISHSYAFAVEEPYRYSGLEEEILELAKKSGIDEEEVSSVLPSSYWFGLGQAKRHRFSNEFSGVPDIIPPHPRAFNFYESKRFFPRTYMTALVQQFFPAATSDLFIPNTLRNDPVNNLTPKKIVQLIRLVNRAVQDYGRMLTLPWRISVQKGIESIMGTKHQSLVEDIDTDDFTKYNTARGIVEALKLYIETIDEADPDISAESKAILRSSAPYSRALNYLSSSYFEGGVFEVGFLERVEKGEFPYNEKEAYALKRETFVDILMGAIENQAARNRPDFDIQELLFVFFTRKFAGQTKALEDFYAEYFGISNLVLRSLRAPRIFNFERFAKFRKKLKKDPRIVSYLPADYRMAVAQLEKEQGSFQPTVYTSVTSRTGINFPNCIEESLINFLFFMMRKEGRGGLVFYDPSIFPVGSPARSFMEEFAETYKLELMKARVAFSELLTTAPGVVYVRPGNYELEAGVINGINALLFLLGISSPVSFDRYATEFPDAIAAIQSILPDRATFSVDPDGMTKSSTTRECYGDIEVGNSRGEKMIWALTQGHGEVKIEFQTHRSWVEDLLNSRLTTAEARRIIPLVSTPEHFKAVAGKWDPYDRSSLYRSIDYNNAEMAVAIIGDIVKNLLRGRREGLGFLRDLGKTLQRLDDDHAYARAYEALVPAVLNQFIDDKDRKTILEGFPYVLTGHPMDGRKCEVLEWACANRRSDLFSLHSAGALKPFCLNLTTEIIRNHHAFLGAHIGTLDVIIVKIALTKFEEEMTIRAIARALPTAMESLYLYAYPPKAGQFVVESMPDMKGLKSFDMYMDSLTPFSERFKILQTALRRHPDLEINPGKTFTRSEVVQMEEVLEKEFGRPRPYKSGWIPADDPIDRDAGAAGGGGGGL